ncbi:Sterol 3-beta-glucosyltransferase [Mortierella alpina]|nr:Sterol 3-beta-glucosyltransferase [Mortierella alpina]
MELNKLIKPPTSGSALLQFVAAALRSENMNGSQARSDFGSEEEDDLVHVDDAGIVTAPRRMLIRQESVQGLGIHSDGEEDITDDEGQHRPHRYLPRSSHHHQEQPHASVKGKEAGDIPQSTSGLSLGPARDKKSLAEKLQSAFKYPEVEEYLGDYSCCLARSVLLPGYMYLTTNHICFYANVHQVVDGIQKKGFFSKKSRTTKQFTRYWFKLQNDVLTYYVDQSDEYYPIKSIDLKDALSAEPKPDSDLTFQIFTEERKYTFKTDSELTRSDWVKALQKAIHHSKTNDEKVMISIPLASVLDVEMNTMAFAEAIQIKVMESDESFALDEYYFAYFNDTAKALRALKEQVKSYQQRRISDPTIRDRIYDSTSPHATASRKSAATTHTSAVDATQSPPLSPTLTATSSLLSPIPTGSKRNSLRLPFGDYTKASSRSTSPIIKSQPTSDTEDSEREKSRHALSFSMRGTTSWIADHKIGFGSAEDSHTVNAKEQEAFLEEFKLPRSEGLSAVVSGSLLRYVPLSGRVYLSDNYLCYRSSTNISFWRTRLTVPLKDIEVVNKAKGTGFFSHGLSLLTQMGKEIFFEFSSTETRNTILNTLRDRITPEAQEQRRKQRAQTIADTPSAELDNPMDTRCMDSVTLSEEPIHVEPPYAKPSGPLRITCLTIGSRGDVQPYIALCKRLMKDGHHCRIATHGEYKDWIEGHGIEFGLVGGDPGELIELCVENGMFTVSFFREGLKRFRGWLDELMETAWVACQDTDVLIESPSAMAGIHIAEKLAIPYFRAFPFPWTRTRAFPHPFAVPEHNLGRGYNYMTYVMIEQVFWKGISGQVNRWRRNTLGLGPTSLEKMEADQVPSLYSWSPHVVPGPIDWRSWIHVTGYWFLDNPDLSWTPPRDLVEFLNADPKKKPIYIGFGSMVVPDPDGMTRTIIEAVVKSGVRAIISKGWSDRLTSQDDPTAAGAKKTPAEEIVIPPSVYMLKSVPHDWLFPQLSGCVHHGGAGTAAAGLRAGIPTVIKPFFGDQYFWAQRLEESGVGVWCHDLTVKKLTSALVTITTDEIMIRKAHAIGERIRQEDGVGKAVEDFYHDLGFAQRRLNRNSKEPAEDTPVKFNTTEGENDWMFIQPSSAASGTASVGEGSESTTGMNVLSGSDEESGSNMSGHTTPHLSAFTELHHSASYQDGHLRSNSNVEPISHVAQASATDPGPDRATEFVKNSDDTVEGMACQLEALQAPSKSPVPFFGSAYGHGESGRDKDGDKVASSKSTKRASTVRKALETLTTKATHMTGYFSPSSSSSSSQHGSQAAPSPLLLDGSASEREGVMSKKQSPSHHSQSHSDSIHSGKPNMNVDRVSGKTHKPAASAEELAAPKTVIGLTSANKLR